MSSTLRSYVRHRSDYYITPVPAIVSFLKEFEKYEPLALSNEVLFLDPAAGGSSEDEMSYPNALRAMGIANVRTIDIRRDSRAEIIDDYLTRPLDFKPGIIITNPPFNLARQFIEKALEDVENEGYVIMLLRLNFYGGQVRRDMWEKQLPKYSFVHNKRISFTKDRKTDSIEYQHCVWQKNHYPEFTRLKVI